MLSCSLPPASANKQERAFSRASDNAALAYPSDSEYRWIPAFQIQVSDGQYRYHETAFGFNAAFYVASNTTTSTFASPTEIPESERSRIRRYFDRFVSPTLIELNLRTLESAFNDNQYLVYNSPNRDQSLRSPGVQGCVLVISGFDGGVRKNCTSNGLDFIFFNSRIDDSATVRRNIIHETLHDWWVDGLSRSERAAFTSALLGLLHGAAHTSSTLADRITAFYRSGAYEGSYDPLNATLDWKLFIEQEGYPVLWEIDAHSYLRTYYSDIFFWRCNTRGF